MMMRSTTTDPTLYVSTAITPNKRLTDYLEVNTNRVLMIDDISNGFIDSDNARGQDDYTEFNVITSSIHSWCSTS